jgi:hypothetical protein
MSISEMVRTIPLVSLAAAVVVSWRSFLYSFPWPLKLFSMMLSFWLIVQGIAHGMAYAGIRNYWVYNIFNPLYFLAIAYIYQQQISSATIRRIIVWFYGLFVLVFLSNTILLQDIASTYQTLIVVIGRSFIIFLAAAYFWQLYNDAGEVKVSQDPFFWFSFGFILHFAATVPFLAMFNYLYGKYPGFTKSYYFYFINSFATLQYFLVIAGYLCRKNFQKRF